ncbi:MULTISPECIES: diacylglycerol kinase family protein [Variovorax]|uniref:Diacylglycerol kinase family enzyme n=1 Tax=Variovorax boronicumulans TaxID=436515 RepID=A0AAW8E7F1_9BURK|nr:diacylglycerol kinase family protein [Variovorax boronicumulans]MDP9882512.1 diacylglycerol kinase family enzyme [Variovorax boronicumulans]MDP9914319.1 diacylglycerol kinase family enzyme [Variovorax boronicumulans]MDP9927798.1 diacylglycerol kinase family enzyme [Variovorax boronicumulans]GER17513.1 diacylglycerol kinase [Variovorax boronicumulans]
MASPHIGPDTPFFIVLNAGSGSEDAAQARQVIDDAFAADGRRHRVFLVDGPGRVQALAREAVERARAVGGVVVAAGGDGTINAVAQATLGSGCPFGVLPQGTFNYFSRTHGIPRDTAQALQVLLTQQPRAVQVGLVNDRVFLVNASMGLYADLLEERESHKARFGRHRWIAFYSGLLTVLRGRHRHWQLRIASHGHERDIRTPTLFVGNNPLQLMQAGVDHAEAPEQGRLTAVALKPVGLLSMPGLLVRGALGRLGDADEVLSFPFESMTVKAGRLRTPRRVKIATDGEIDWVDMPLLFRVAPDPLWLVRPDSAPELEAARP